MSTFSVLAVVIVASVLTVVSGFEHAWQKEFTSAELHEMDTARAFKQWARFFDRDYPSVEEEASRFLVWLDSAFKVAQYNSQPELTFKLRLNQFGDMSGDEFRSYVHGKDGRCFKPAEIQNRHGKDIVRAEPVVSLEPVNAPDSIDWTSKGVVTPVKNQGQCGSCWAFSATGALECEYAIKYGTLNSLSEQQLVDCAGLEYGCSGCNGGEMSGAMRYTAKEGGLCLESEYKYTARDGTCKASSCGTKYDANKAHTAVTVDSEPAMLAAAAEGCVSIGIEADQTAFQYYSSGVLTGTCGTSIDHGVLIVGYGSQGAQDYWKVKNSWGSDWGMEGYVLICRNCHKNNGAGECGILTGGNVPTF